MRSLKMLVAASLGLVAVAAVAATSAVAAEWKVNGAGLGVGNTAAIAQTAAVIAQPTVSTPSVTIQCSGNNVTIGGGVVMGLNVGGTQSMTFSGCTIINGGVNCILVNPTINILPLNITVTKGAGTADLDTLKPKTKTTLATIGFSGSSCALLGTQPLTGELLQGDTSEQTEKTLQDLEEISSAGLKLGSSSATWESSINFKLASGSPWSYS